MAGYWQHAKKERGQYLWVIDQACSVKMVGYWPSSFLRVYLDSVLVQKHAKKEIKKYPAILTEQAWSIKDLLFGFGGNFSCGKRRVVPAERAR